MGVEGAAPVHGRRGPALSKPARTGFDVRLNLFGPGRFVVPFRTDAGCSGTVLPVTTADIGRRR